MAIHESLVSLLSQMTLQNPNIRTYENKQQRLILTLFLFFDSLNNCSLFRFLSPLCSSCIIDAVNKITQPACHNAQPIMNNLTLSGRRRRQWKSISLGYNYKSYYSPILERPPQINLHISRFLFSMYSQYLVFSLLPFFSENLSRITAGSAIP